MTLWDISKRKKRDCPVLIITKMWLTWNIQDNVFKVTVCENLVALLFHLII